MARKNSLDAEALRVAVIVPCFNDGEFVASAVDSLRGEEPHELVVIDDGSSDPRTLAALTELSSLGVRVVRQENAGISAARRAGVANTRARYVFPLDADDEVCRGALGRLADALDADGDIGAVWGDVRVTGTISAVQLKAPSLDPWLITFLNEYPLTALYRREALESVGSWSLPTEHQDWDLWMSLAERGVRGTKLPFVHYRYRQHSRPRARARGAARYDEIVAEMRSRHPALFAARRHFWWRSPEPWRIRLVLPVIASVPGLAPAGRARLYDLALRVLDRRRRFVVDGRPEPGPIRRLLGSTAGKDAHS